jgi:hypothetical protein
MCGFCTVGVCMCVSFGNMCTCIYFVVCTAFFGIVSFIYIYVFLLDLSVMPSSDDLIAVNNNSNNNNNNNM